jgi:hypothetical protein
MTIQHLLKLRVFKVILMAICFTGLHVQAKECKRIFKMQTLPPVPYQSHTYNLNLESISEPSGWEHFRKNVDLFDSCKGYFNNLTKNTSGLNLFTLTDLKDTQIRVHVRKRIQFFGLDQGSQRCTTHNKFNINLKHDSPSFFNMTDWSNVKACYHCPTPGTGLSIDNVTASVTEGYCSSSQLRPLTELELSQQAAGIIPNLEFCKNRLYECENISILYYGASMTERAELKKQYDDLLKLMKENHCANHVFCKL